MIKESFFDSLYTFDLPVNQIIQLWYEIEKKYTSSKRYYHNLTHLDNLIKELAPLKDQFKNWNIIVLAIAYHDIIYNPLKGNNEEKSAKLAKERLSHLSLPEVLIQECEALILATKKHEASALEVNLFTDADLSILGADPEVYKNYTAQIRKEYSIYPNILYYPGRKKVLSHFLEMEKIYKSAHFYAQYESKARINLKEELKEIENGTI